MIKNEVVNILNQKSEFIKVEMIGELTDEFRSGRNPSELLELLKSSDKNILSIALYILGEINITDINISKGIIRRLKILSSHKDTRVRYKTLINLASLSHEVNADELNNIYEKMSQDLNEGIRENAKELLRTGNLSF